MTEKKKRGRGRPKGAPNKPKMELITKRERLTKNADVYEILCQADLVAKDNKEHAVNGLKVFGANNGAVAPVLMWLFNESKILIFKNSFLFKRLKYPYKSILLIWSASSIPILS